MEERLRHEIKSALLKCSDENEGKGTYTGYVVVSSVCRSAVERIAELEKENQELLKSVEGATAMYGDLQEARKQIERLKNCANCRHSGASIDGYPYWCLEREVEITGYGRCNDWEAEK